LKKSDNSDDDDEDDDDDDDDDDSCNKCEKNQSVNRNNKNGSSLLVNSELKSVKKSKLSNITNSKRIASMEAVQNIDDNLTSKTGNDKLTSKNEQEANTSRIDSDSSDEGDSSDSDIVSFKPTREKSSPLKAVEVKPSKTEEDTSDNVKGGKSLSQKLLTLSETDYFMLNAKKKTEDSQEEKEPEKTVDNDVSDGDEVSEDEEDGSEMDDEDEEEGNKKDFYLQPNYTESRM
jgi:hypothetical protein